MFLFRWGKWEDVGVYQWEMALFMLQRRRHKRSGRIQYRSEKVCTVSPAGGREFYSILNKDVISAPNAERSVATGAKSE